MSFERRLLLQSWYFSADRKSETCQFSLDSTRLTKASHLSTFQTKGCEVSGLTCASSSKLFSTTCNIVKKHVRQRQRKYEININIYQISSFKTKRRVEQSWDRWYNSIIFPLMILYVKGGFKVIGGLGAIGKHVLMVLFTQWNVCCLFCNSGAWSCDV